MKTFIFAISLLVSTLGFSQISINLSETTTNVSGTVQPYELTNTVMGHSMYYFDIINSSGNNLNLQITRKIISETTGWSNFLCFGPAPFGACYPASTDIIWNTNSEIIIDTATLSTYVSAPSSGAAHYRYYVSEDGVNFLDSVDILINSTADLSMLEMNSIELFPNPANDVIHVKNDTPISIRLTNSLGAEVLSDPTMSTSKQLDISTLPTGIYLLSIKSIEGEICKRIQVK